MSNSMNYGLDIPQNGSLDFVSLGALNHRVDSGIIPFRKATEWHVYPSGGEYNVAANLSDCFQMRTGIVSAEQMGRARKIIILVVVILAAFLAPSPDVYSQMLVAIPMLGLFEIGLLLARVSERRRAAALQEDAGTGPE